MSERVTYAGQQHGKVCLVNADRFQSVERHDLPEAREEHLQLRPDVAAYAELAQQADVLGLIARRDLLIEAILLEGHYAAVIIWYEA